MNRFAKAMLAGSAAIMCVAATGNWLATVEQTAKGHRMGNPQADVKLVEYVSYTCSHCANFERQSEGALKLAFVHPGKMSVEIRHFIRDPVDLTAAMLTNCGPKDRFFQNHTLFMLTQKDWLPKASAATSAQQKRWTSGDIPSRLRAVTSDLGFYPLMESRGYSRMDVNTCLADEAAARAIVEKSFADIQEFKIQGTPSFMVDGKLLDGVHSWPALENALKPLF